MQAWACRINASHVAVLCTCTPKCQKCVRTKTHTNAKLDTLVPMCARATGPYGFRKWRTTVDYDLPIGAQPLPVGAIPPPLVWWYDVAWRMGAAQHMGGMEGGDPSKFPHPMHGGKFLLSYIFSQLY